MKNHLLIGPLVFSLSACGAAVDSDFDGPTSTAVSELTVASWRAPIALPGLASGRAPALAYLDGALHMVYVSGSSGTELWHSVLDRAWSAPTRISDHTSAGIPALAAYGDQLYMAYRQPGTANIRVTRSAGTGWISASTVTTSRCPPSLTTAGGRLFMATCAMDSSYMGQPLDMKSWVRLHSFDGHAWRPETNIQMGPSLMENLGVAIASAGGRLHVVTSMISRDWLLPDSYGVQGTSGLPGEAFPMGRPINRMRSRNPPALTVCNGAVHLVVSGVSDPTSLWWTYRPATTNNVGWALDARIANQPSGGGAGLGCRRYSEPYLVHNGTSVQLWSSIFSP